MTTTLQKNPETIQSPDQNSLEDTSSFLWRGMCMFQIFYWLKWQLFFGISNSHCETNLNRFVRPPHSIFQLSIKHSKVVNSVNRTINLTVFPELSQLPNRCRILTHIKYLCFFCSERKVVLKDWYVVVSL